MTSIHSKAISRTFIVCGFEPDTKRLTSSVDPTDLLQQNASNASVRVMTYNIHGGVGNDRRLDLSRIAEVIAQQNVDIVALQELDVGRSRSGRLHQAEKIAEQLGMAFQFHPAFLLQEDEQYGDAILSRWPMKLVRAGVLPTLITNKILEPRGALWVEIEYPRPHPTQILTPGKLQVINTHLGLARTERRLQAMELLGENWIGHEHCRPPAILCGDFNSLPWGRVYRLLTKQLRDAQPGTGQEMHLRWPRATFPSRRPFLTLDYFFLSTKIFRKQIKVVNDPLTKIASDHLPLVADLELDHPSHLSS